MKRKSEWNLGVCLLVLGLGAFVILSPVVAPANEYEYKCEADADGEEGLCIAEPTTEIPPKKKKTSSIAETESSREPRSEPRGQPTNQLMFGATDESAEEIVPELAPKDSSAAVQAIRAQEKIRQVETFLQNTKGPDGGLGTSDQGPIKADK